MICRSTLAPQAKRRDRSATHYLPTPPPGWHTTSSSKSWTQPRSIGNPKVFLRPLLRVRIYPLRRLPPIILRLWNLFLLTYLLSYFRVGLAFTYLGFAIYSYLLTYFHLLYSGLGSSIYSSLTHTPTSGLGLTYLGFGIYSLLTYLLTSGLGFTYLLGLCHLLLTCLLAYVLAYLLRLWHLFLLTHFPVGLYLLGLRHLFLLTHFPVGLYLLGLRHLFLLTHFPVGLYLLGLRHLLYSLTHLLTCLLSYSLFPHFRFTFMLSLTPVLPSRPSQTNINQSTGIVGGRGWSRGSFGLGDRRVSGIVQSWRIVRSRGSLSLKDR